MANSYVADTQKAAVAGLSRGQSGSIFKMKKFTKVPKRTDSRNHTYVPVQRGKSELGRARKTFV